MKNKKKFNLPSIEVIKLETKDFIITTSKEPWAPDEPIGAPIHDYEEIR